jgi:4-carboxymuconolactone decarboxylase
MSLPYGRGDAKGAAMTVRWGSPDDVERGRELFERMQLGPYPEPKGDEFDLFNALATDVQWPSTWAGEGLDVKTRSLCTVAALIATGKPQLHGHIRAALTVGATRQEIADVITHVAFYAGFPSSGNAMRAAKQVFAELDGESDT